MKATIQRFAMRNILSVITSSKCCLSIRSKIGIIIDQTMTRRILKYHHKNQTLLMTHVRVRSYMYSTIPILNFHHDHRAFDHFRCEFWQSKQTHVNINIARIYLSYTSDDQSGNGRFVNRVTYPVRSRILYVNRDDRVN